MKTLKLPGIYQVIVGIGMMVIWILNFINGSIPELQTEPWDIAAHLTAEAVTAIMLLVSGLSILFGKKRKALYYLASGALIYTLIASPGYFAQTGDWGAVFLFIILLVITLVLMIFTEREKSAFLIDVH